MSFADIKHETYDPETEGYGNPDEWRATFTDRVGVENALELLSEDDPLSILGLKSNALWGDIRAAYKRMSLKWRPDRHKQSDESQEMMKRINAAYEILESRFKQ